MMVNKDNASSIDIIGRLVIRAEKTYTRLERSHSFPREHISTKLAHSEVAKAPCPQYKEWTHDHQGLEFMLSVTIGLVPQIRGFGPFN